MKTPRLLYFIALLGLTGCYQAPYPSCEDVVCETYIHRYGVPLDPDDWSARGQNGQVVATRKDGVIVSRTYEAGVLHGECTYTFPYRDKIQKKEVYNQGALISELDYYPSGLPGQQVTYESPVRHSLIGWYESGAPKHREEYENGRLLQGEYYNTANQIESQVADFNGLRTKRDGQGQLDSVDTVQNGQMTLSTTYHPNGTPAALTPYVNGVIEGQRKTYSAGGEPETIETWTRHQQHGPTIVFEHGEKLAEAPYVNGRKHGIERRYRDGKNLVQEVTWEQGRKQGPCYTYVGDQSKVDWYFNDRLVNKATYDMYMNQ